MTERSTSGRSIRTALLAGVALLAALAIPRACSHMGPAVGEGPPIAGEDPAEGVELQRLPELAAGFLSTDRPWRASRVMDRYLSEADDPDPTHRLLAARAEAGWGDWARARELLEGLPSLETVGDGVGPYILGRARDETDDPEGAVEAYRAFLGGPAPGPELAAERDAARLRLGLALLRTGREEEGREVLASLRPVTAAGGPWPALLEADAFAAAGDTAAARRVAEAHDEGIPGLLAWRARIRAARRAGDESAARELSDRARRWATTDGTRAEFILSGARSALAGGDEDGAREALREAIREAGSAGPWARQAAELLADSVPGASRAPAADALAVARVQAAQGLHREATEGFRRWLEAEPGARGSGAPGTDEVRMEYANALFYSERYDEVDEALRPLDSDDARFLLARAAAHRDDHDRAVEIYLRLAAEHAGTGTGSRALFLAAGTRHDEGDDEAARTLYRRVIERYGGRGEEGLARMRLAGMAFLDEDYAGAAEQWSRYRSRYPSGSRALQSTYWLGRAREAMGDSAAAAALYREVRSAERDSYYALVASRRLGEPFWPLPMTGSPPADPAASSRVEGWMRAVDLLLEAGFPELAEVEVARIAGDAARGDLAVRYALAEALAERGYTQRAILIGIGLGQGTPNLRLLRIRYPFPYRTLITEEARERGVDPFVAAALIRQESMFEARITSHVGARGLMQIMPATGRGLALAAGIEPWDPEALYHPEINVHLGIGLLADHLERYDGSLPSVFSAYNAGEHRVEWWSDFPSYGREELFTERIPYAETRDYVKILTRNRALYEGMYGGSP